MKRIPKRRASVTEKPRACNFLLPARLISYHNMALFGLTTLGPEDPIKDQAAHSQLYTFHEIDPEIYEEAFSKYLLGPDAQLTKILEIDGATSVLRASLGDMLRIILGRAPRKFELDAWFTHLDFDRSAILGIEEYRWRNLSCALNETLYVITAPLPCARRACVANLIEFSSNPQHAKEYTSFTLYNETWRRHGRPEYELQRTNKGPMTNNQELGERQATLC